MTGKVENVNTDILQQCREQIGLSLFEVEKKIKKIAEIEGETQKPTFKQLDTLSELYKVPRWVFVSKQLPDKYQFDKAVPSFRQLANSNAGVFSDSKVRSLTARVERFRDLILELLDDMGETIVGFNPPEVSDNTKPEDGAMLIRKWLGLSDEKFDFETWKKLLEEKGVFVFMTSKYKGWSHIDKKLLRGLAIYHSTLPIIIINDSDAKKAQSFTLFHELGHLLKKESAIDDWEYHERNFEDWCDKLAGNVLMPARLFQTAASSIDNLNTVKSIARNFRVSAYACLVRLRQLEIINQNTYEDYEVQIIDEFTKLQEKLKDSAGGPSRDRPQEVLNQYGHIYTNVLFQAYHNQEIGLHKLSKLFNLKKSSYILEMEKML
ncbi:MAG: ImmA/IrrE family metallo-endopeptidase [Candidatus Kuenenia sp.]|nr:ImmA/IrrE family metallo-endopeptidase [Candidatus Kuenenia sp.]